MLAEVDRFVNWVRRRSPEAHTWMDYRSDLQHFARSVGEHPLQAVTIQQVDLFVQEQVVQGFKPTTINRRLAAVLSLYAFFAEEDAALVCPVLPHRHHLRQPQHLPRPVPEDDLRAFFGVIEDARDRAMFTLMLRCGLRISEVAKLQLADLFLEEDFPRFVVRGKGSRERGVYLSPQAKRTLKLYLSERPAVASDFVFLSYLEDGLSTTAIRKRLMRYRDEAAIAITAHQLRHTFANDLLNADVPVTSIQKLMGHRWIDTTQTYVMANDRQVCADYFAACAKLESWHVAGA